MDSIKRAQRIFAISVSLITILIATGCGSDGSVEQVINDTVIPERQVTLEEIKPIAKDLYQDFAKKHEDQLEDGPCLGIIANEWAVDIAHSPRLTSDNEPQNQCEPYQSGKVQHLLEFSPRGQIITIK